MLKSPLEYAKNDYPPAGNPSLRAQHCPTYALPPREGGRLTPVTDRSFGLLIAYVLPGFAAISVWGGKPSVIGLCQSASTGASPTVGGFLYVTVASVAVGVLLSTVRWAAIDRIHHLTGLKPPRWSPGTGDVSLEAYQLVVDQHYRYYQFYGSSLLLAAGCLLAPPANALGASLESATGRLTLVALAALCFAASRDTLERCYRTRAESPPPGGATLSSGDETMTNGGPHEAAGGNSPQSTADAPTRAVAEKSSLDSESGVKVEPSSHSATTKSTK